MSSNKGHRVASKQAQLSRKKRRNGKGRPQEFFPGPTQTESEPASDTAIQEPAAVEAENQAVQQQPEAARAPARAAVATAPRPRTAPRRARPQRATAAQPPAVYKYLGTELRHIGIISAVIIVILVVLTFVLG